MASKKDIKKKVKELVTEPEVPALELDTFELSKKIGRVLGDINIPGLSSHVQMVPAKKVSTACWVFNKKNKTFTIKVNIELVHTLEEPELRLLLEHELLHHFRYQNCDNRNPLMTNIVLDAAINKMLYLFNPETMCSMADKIYFDKITREKGLEQPFILACPTLMPEEIEAIPDEGIRQAYIDIWGSRQTPADYDQTLPDPTELFFKLLTTISEEQAQSPFGEESDEEGDGEGEGEGSGEGEDDGEADSDSKSGEGGKGGKSKDGKNDKKDKSKSKRKRCTVEDEDEDETEEEEKDGEGSDGESDDEKEDEKEDGDSSGNGDKKDEDSEDESDSDGDGDEDGDDESDEDDEGYDEISKEVAKIDKDMQDKATGAGKGGSSIQVCTSVMTHVDTKELERRLQEMILDRTIEEISHAVIGSIGNEIVQLPYLLRPTSTTLTHMACGLNDVVPMYWNHKDGNTKPKLATYIDVSGSMDSLIPLVRSIIVKITEYLPSIVFAFDTNVAPVYTSHFANAHLCGGGTSFNRVFDHICLDGEARRNWLEKLIKKWSSKGKNSNRNYYDDDDVDFDVLQIDGAMLDSEIITDDAPAILLVTDGEDRLENKYINKFKNLGKKLIVLQFVNSYYNNNEYNVKDSPFYEIADQLFLANSKGEIKSKSGV